MGIGFRGERKVLVVFGVNFLFVGLWVDGEGFWGVWESGFFS